MVEFIVSVVLCAILGYLLGSINSSLLVGKLYNVDVRNHGSGNAGTTNVLRTLGKKAALLTFVGDLLKGIMACLLGKAVMAIMGELFGRAVSLGINHPEHVGLMAAGTLCVIGHNWPVYFGFKGGKGVLTTFAVFLMMAPIPALITLGVFILVVILSKYISLASMLAAVFLPVFVFVAHLLKWNVNVPDIAFYLAFCIPLSALIIVKHKKNIRKLIDGTENKLSLKKSKGGVE